MRKHTFRVPNNLNELMDTLSWFLGLAPKFEDTVGYFPFLNIDTAYEKLNGGLLANRSGLGDERYRQLVTLSDRTRAYFEADPNNHTGDAQKGKELVYEMERIVRSAITDR